MEDMSFDIAIGIVRERIRQEVCSKCDENYKCPSFKVGHGEFCAYARDKIKASYIMI